MSLSSPQEIIIEPGGISKNYTKDLWESRELVFIMAWRNILLRYKQTVVGLTWVLIKPIIPMILFTLLFSSLAELPSGETPYTLFVLVGLIIWQYIASVIGESASTALEHAHMIRKIYFPRTVFILALCLSYAVDLAIMLAFFFLFSCFFGIDFSPRLLLMFPFLLLSLALVLGVSFWVSALTLRFRDFRHVVPFVLQIGLFASPVAYGALALPPEWLAVFYMNPLVGIIEGLRFSLLGEVPPFFLLALFTSVVISVVLLVSGFRFFRSTERLFAEIL